MDEEPSQQRTNDTSVACPEDQLNGCNTSERQGNRQSEADNLSHKDEEPGAQTKKQKTNDTSDACPAEDQLNGCNTSKRQGSNKSDAYNLSLKDLEPGQQRKKQKTNATSDACPEDVVTENASFGLKSNIAPNKNSVLQNKRKQVHVTEHEQSVENAVAHEDGNGNSSQNRCSPVVNQNVEADKHVSLTNSHECESSDEIEATSSNDSGKQLSPPWRNMRHHKAKFQEKERVVSNNSKKALGCQDQHTPSPSRERKYPPKRYSNPLAPAGRRSKLCWTEEEEQALRDAMLKFTPKDDEPIPWIQILEYGRDVFHKTRLASDLRVKWRNMKKKSESYKGARRVGAGAGAGGQAGRLGGAAGGDRARGGWPGGVWQPRRQVTRLVVTRNQFLGESFNADEARTKWPQRYQSGPAKRPDEEDVKARCQHRSAKVDDVVYALGGDVYVMAGENEADYISRITEFFEGTDRCHYFTCRWFLFVQRTRTKFVDDHTHGPKCVFLSEEMNDNVLDYIISKVMIVYVDPNKLVKDHPGVATGPRLTHGSIRCGNGGVNGRDR